MNDPTQVVGERLKTLRVERGLSVRDLAQASDLAFNTISLIERGRVSPTVVTLHKLATALAVPVAYFVTSGASRRVVFLKSGERDQACSSHVLLENLGTGLPDQTLQFLLLTLRPDADSGSDPIVHLGTELAFCLEGCVEYRVEDRAYAVESGDSLLFEAHLPHRWRNGLQQPSRLLLVLQAEQGLEIALSRHLESHCEVRRPHRAWAVGGPA